MCLRCIWCNRSSKPMYKLVANEIVANLDYKSNFFESLNSSELTVCEDCIGTVYLAILRANSRFVVNVEKLTSKYTNFFTGLNFKIFRIFGVATLLLLLFLIISVLTQSYYINTCESAMEWLVLILFFYMLFTNAIPLLTVGSLVCIVALYTRVALVLALKLKSSKVPKFLTIILAFVCLLSLFMQVLVLISLPILIAFSESLSETYAVISFDFFPPSLSIWIGPVNVISAGPYHFLILLLLIIIYIIWEKKHAAAMRKMILSELNISKIYEIWSDRD
ncbi:MAG: hypothetical protein ACP6IS_11930 [Candidatus Asgardarchaeia archaeon]